MCKMLIIHLLTWHYCNKKLMFNKNFKIFFLLSVHLLISSSPTGLRGPCLSVAPTDSRLGAIVVVRSHVGLSLIFLNRPSHPQHHMLA